MSNSNKNNTTTSTKGKGSNSSRGSQKRKPQKARPSEKKFDTVLQHSTKFKDEFNGFIFIRAVKVDLPNGSSKLMPLEDEQISLNFKGKLDLIPTVLRLLESENKKCPDFATQSKATQRHSVESKLLIYLEERRDSNDLGLLKSSLKKSEIVSPTKK